MVRAAVLWLAAMIALLPHAAQAAPAGRISALTTAPGRVQFLFTAQGLPSDAQLDTGSAKVTAEGRRLPVTAEPPGAARSLKSPGASTSRAAMLVLDTSGSMGVADLAAAKQGALAFLQRLPADVSAGLTTTGTPSRLALAPTTSRSALTAAIKAVRAGGETALYDAMTLALSQLRLARTGEGRLVVLSDGRDSASRTALPVLLSRLARERVPADVVAFKTAATSAGTLRRLAQESGGSLLSSPDARRMIAAFGQAAGSFSQAMWITATVPDALDGKKIRLTVEVGAGAVTVRAGTQVALAAGAGAAGHGAPPASALPDEGYVAGGGVPLGAVLGCCFATLFFLALLVFRRRDSKPAWARQIDQYRVRPKKQPVPNASDAGHSAVMRSALGLSQRVVGTGTRQEQLARELERAGLALRPNEWTLLRIAAWAALTVLLAALTSNVVFTPVIAAVVTWAGTRTYLRAKAERRLMTFSEQLPNALQLVASSLRTGFSVSQALERLAQQDVQPLGAEMSRALAQTQLGVSIEDALDSVADRMSCRDLSWVVLAIRIQRAVGGNLAEVIETTVETMRERTRLRRHVRALSAEGRISAYILIALPLVTAAALMVIRPGYMRPLHTTPAGLAISTLAIVLMSVGWIWMSRTVKVEA